MNEHHQAMARLKELIDWEIDQLTCADGVRMSPCTDKPLVEELNKP